MTNRWNTFYWNRNQFPDLSSTFKSTGAYTDSLETDRVRGRWRHYLGGPDTGFVTINPDPIFTLSLERDPSPNGTTEGQIIWYDYAGKPSRTQRGPQKWPSVVARLMPDSTSWYKYYEYNGFGKPTKLIETWDESGTARYRTNLYSYSGDGIDLTEEWHGTNKVLAATYVNHLPTIIVTPIGSTTNLYDSTNRLISSRSPAGMLTTNIYGSNGFLSQSIDSMSGTNFRSRSYTWATNRLQTFTDERGAVWNYTWDGLNRLTKVVVSGFSTNQYFYTSGSTNILDLGVHIDAMGKTNTFAYDSFRNVTRRVDPNGTVTLWSYCLCGGPEYITFASGTGVETTAQYVYDKQGRMTTYYPPDIDLGGKFFTYDILGRLIKWTDPITAVTNTYDNLNRQIRANNAWGQIEKTVYDEEDRATSYTDRNGVTTTTSYDSDGRVRWASTQGRVRNYSYTANVVSPTALTNEISKVTSFGYDAANRRISESVAGVYTNTFSYFPGGELKTLADGKGNTTSWGVDALGRTTSKTNGITEVLRYTYDANNRIKTRVTPAKGTTSYSYDNNANILSIDYPISSDITYKYDALNRLTNMVDAVGTNSFTYNGAGQLLTEGGVFPNDTVRITYNSAGLRSGLSITQPVASFTNGYTWDVARRLSRITSHSGTFDYAYHRGLNFLTNPTVLVQQLNLPNGAFITNTYGSSAQLSRTELRATSTINLHDYSYNSALQRMDQGFPNGDLVDYSYDDAGQMYRAESWNTSTEDFGYKYDPAFNLNARTNNGVVTTFTVNNLNQISAVGGTILTYDANGSLTNYGSNLSYLYDDENQLIQVQSAGSWRVTYSYDGMRRLRKRALYSGPSYTLTSETRFIYDGILTVQERDGSNVPTVTYTRGLDLHSSLADAGGIGGLLGRSHGYTAGTGVWGTHNFYHADANGNITYLIDTNKTLAASYRYNPHGVVAASSGALAVANRMQFASKWSDDAAALINYGYRWYIPSLQRWLSVDPLTDVATLPSSSAERDPGIELNPYNFVDNDPINDVDPFGLRKNRGGPSGNCNKGQLKNCKDICDAEGKDVESCNMTLEKRLIYVEYIGLERIFHYENLYIMICKCKSPEPPPSSCIDRNAPPPVFTPPKLPPGRRF